MPRSNKTNKKSDILYKKNRKESVEIKPLDSAKSSKELIESISDVEIAWMAGLLEGEGGGTTVWINVQSNAMKTQPLLIFIYVLTSKSL